MNIFRYAKMPETKINPPKCPNCGGEFNSKKEHIIIEEPDEIGNHWAYCCKECGYEITAFSSDEEAKIWNQLEEHK